MEAMDTIPHVKYRRPLTAQYEKTAEIYLDSESKDDFKSNTPPKAGVLDLYSLILIMNSPNLFDEDGNKVIVFNESTEIDGGSLKSSTRKKSTSRRKSSRRSSRRSNRRSNRRSTRSSNRRSTRRSTRRSNRRSARRSSRRSARRSSRS